MPAKPNLLPGFEPKPRKKPQKLMHVCDVAGECGCECEPGEQTVRFECKRCGYVSEWMKMPSITAAKRGVPCPQCNGEK